jgi:hypothetical protein
MTGQEEGRLLHRRDHGWDECGQRAAGPLLGLAYNVSRRRLEMGHLAWGCCRRPLLRHADAACNWARPHRTIAVMQRGACSGSGETRRRSSALELRGPNFGSDRHMPMPAAMRLSSRATDCPEAGALVLAAVRCACRDRREPHLGSGAVEIYRQIDVDVGSPLCSGPAPSGLQSERQLMVAMASCRLKRANRTGLHEQPAIGRAVAGETQRYTQQHGMA